jgi:hypothetical protein
MDRIGPAGGSPTVAIADGQMGFVDQNLSVAQQGTRFPALFFNALQEEIMNVLAAAGITPNINNWTQLLQAMGTLQKFQNRVLITPVGSGPWTVPAGVTLLSVEVWGGGGAGGAGFGGAGGGGAAGGYSSGFMVVTPGGIVACTVGNGATGSGAGTGTTFGPFSGGGGASGANGASGTGGAGGASPGAGAAGSGALEPMYWAGTQGGAGFVIGSELYAGAGGSSFKSGNVAGLIGTSTATANAAQSPQPGQGGAGAVGNGLGGQGGAGAVLILY